MNVRPFRVQDFTAIDLQPHQANARELVTPWYLELLKDAGPAITIEESGAVLLCAGIGYVPPQPPTFWSFVSADAGRQALGVIRALRRFLDAAPYRAIVSTAAGGFAPSCRALALLGFRESTRLEAHGPDGEDHVLFIRGVY